MLTLRHHCVPHEACLPATALKIPWCTVILGGGHCVTDVIAYQHHLYRRFSYIRGLMECSWCLRGASRSAEYVRHVAPLLQGSHTANASLKDGSQEFTLELCRCVLKTVALARFIAQSCRCTHFSRCRRDAQHGQVVHTHQEMVIIYDRARIAMVRGM